MDVHYFSYWLFQRLCQAHFLENDGFVDHARETGLADAPQVGVAYERHHAFKLGELIQAIKENSLDDMLEHVKWILVRNNAIQLSSLGLMIK